MLFRQPWLHFRQMCDSIISSKEKYQSLNLYFYTNLGRNHCPVDFSIKHLLWLSSMQLNAHVTCFQPAITSPGPCWIHLKEVVSLGILWDYFHPVMQLVHPLKISSTTRWGHGKWSVSCPGRQSCGWKCPIKWMANDSELPSTDGRDCWSRTQHLWHMSGLKVCSFSCQGQT